jgi:hypothetical protein
MADKPDILQPASTVDAETGKPFPTPGQPEGNNFPGEYIPATRKECDSENPGAGGGFGIAAAGYPYIWYGNISQKDYEEAKTCDPFYHYTATIDSLHVTTDIAVPAITGAGGGNCAVTGVASGNKLLSNFDIPHVNDDKKRIRHICIEGPEAGIYVRGRLTGSNVIKLPEYWDGLIDPESITVTLTQIRTSQDLIVDAIEWGKVIKIKSGNAGAIDCFYEVWAARWLNPMDHSEKLHVVYEGDSPLDYPGNNDNFLVGGWDYDRRETKWRRPEDELDSIDLDASPGSAILDE